jgi:hypothetical protein
LANLLVGPVGFRVLLIYVLQALKMVNGPFLQDLAR